MSRPRLHSADILGAAAFCRRSAVGRMTTSSTSKLLAAVVSADEPFRSALEDLLRSFSPTAAA